MNNSFPDFTTPRTSESPFNYDAYHASVNFNCLITG